MHTHAHLHVCTTNVLTSMQEMLPSASVEIHIAASKALAEAVQKDLIPVHIFSTMCLPPILSLLDSKDKCEYGRRGERVGGKGRGKREEEGGKKGRNGQRAVLKTTV